MTCTDAQLLINRLLDGEIHDADAATLFTHLSGCPVCRQFYRDSLKVQSAMRVLAGRSMADSHGGIRNPQLAIRNSPRPAWISQVAVFAAALALVVIGVLGTLAVTRFNAEREQTDAVRVMWVLPEREITPSSIQTWR